ncbi:MAG TPA: PAS domain S-box protein [Candidatus Limnocylindrales bacterium]
MISGIERKREPEFASWTLERLEAVFQAVSDGIAVRGPDGRLLYANLAAARLVGYERPEDYIAADRDELVGRYELFEESGKPLQRSELPGRIALTGQQPPPRILRYRSRETGEELWSRVSATPLWDERLGGWLSVIAFYDITDFKRVEFESEKNAAASRLLADATRRLDESLDFEAMTRTATSLAVPRLADWCAFDLIEPDGTVRRAAVVTADRQLESIASGLFAYPTVLGENRRPGARAIAVREPYILEGITREAIIDEWGYTPEQAEIWVALGTTSALVIPLLARGDVHGVMFLGATNHSRQYERSAAELATELGSRIALGLANARLYRQEQQARRAAEEAVGRTQRLQSMTAALNRAQTRTDVADILIREGLAATGASGISLYLVSGEAPQLDLIATTGYQYDVLEPWHEIRLDEPVPWIQAAVGGLDVWYERLEDVGGDSPDLAAVVARAGLQALAAIPLVVREQRIGIVLIGYREPHRFDPTDRDFVRTLVEMCGQALDRIRLAETRERLLRDLDAQRARLEAVIRQMPNGVMLAEAPWGRIILANDAVERIWGGPLGAIDDSSAYGEFRSSRPDGTPYEPEDWPLARSLRTGEVVEDEEAKFRRLDGRTGWMNVSSAPIRDRDGGIVAAIVVVDDITERRDRIEQERFLAEATQLVTGSLDYLETVRRVAEIAVPRIADWCAIDLLDEDGALETIAIAHADPAKVALVRQHREQYPPEPSSPSGTDAVARSGKPVVVTEVSQEQVEAAARNDEERRLLAELQIRSYMAVPIIAADEVLGVITFVGAESGHRFGPTELAFAEELAARAGSAIQNARLFRDTARYQKMLDATRDAVTIFNPDSLRISYVSDGASQLVGRSREELLGMSPVDVTEDLTEAGLRQLITPLLEGSAPARNLDLIRVRSDGTRIPVEVAWQYISLPDEPGHIVEIARDIRDRLETQRQLQELVGSEHRRAAELDAVIRTMGEGVVVWDPAGVVTLANPAAEAIFGDIAKLSYPQILARFEDGEQAGPQLGVPSAPVELRLKGRRERWIELRTYPVAGHEEGSRETILVLRDVTEAREQRAVRDAFIGILSHELRTPVTTIYAGAKVLARHSKTMSEDARNGIFEDIHAEAERLHRLVEDVIALTRFGEGTSEIGNEPVLLQRILPTVIRSEQVRWPGLRLDLTLPADLPPVEADPTYVEQVVRNLLSNAAKYGETGAAVQVRAKATEDEVIVRILDDGPGFSAGEEERLFEIFYRSPVTAGSAAGAGIGLFVCARLIAAMDGRIWARRRRKRGAEFGFALRVMHEDS